MLGEIGSKAIGPLVFLILARVLVPEDFGVVAAATVVVSFSQIFWDAGLSKALVQKQDHVADSANVVFWLNLGLGLAMFLLLLASAEVIAWFFQDPRIGQVVSVLSLLAPLAATGSVHTALLQKDFQFKKLFWIRLIATSIPALASIPLAIGGGGYWALVAGALTGQLAQTAVLWSMSAWRPSFKFDRRLATELYRFGRWAMLSALLAWCYVWMDAIFVGHFFGSHDMGLYRMGNTFVTMIFGVMLTSLLPVLYSVFSRAQRDVPKLRTALLFVAKGIALVALPIAFAILALRDPIANLVFGHQWDGIALVIGVLALVHGFSWIVGANGEVYRAVGKPHIETFVTSGMLVIYFSGFLITVQHGLRMFLFARLALALVAMVLHVWVACRYLNTSPYVWLRASLAPAAVSAILWLAIEFTNVTQQRAFHELVFYMALAVSAYVVYLACFERRYLAGLMAIVNPKVAQ